MSKTIEIDAVSQWGNIRYYVHDPIEAEEIRMLTGDKTISDAQINVLRGLGFEVQVRPALKKPEWA